MTPYGKNAVSIAEGGKDLAQAQEPSGRPRSGDETHDPNRQRRDAGRMRSGRPPALRRNVSATNRPDRASTTDQMAQAASATARIGPAGWQATLCVHSHRTAQHTARVMPQVRQGRPVRRLKRQTSNGRGRSGFASAAPNKRSPSTAACAALDRRAATSSRRGGHLTGVAADDITRTRPCGPGGTGTRVPWRCR